VNLDIGEVITRAWQITWKHKMLWVYGFAVGLLTSTMFPLMLVPMAVPILMERNRENTWLIGVLIGGWVVFFLAFMLIMYPVSVLTQTSLTMGILEVEQKQTELSVMEAIKRGLPFFWRALGVMLLFGLGMTLVMMLIQGIVFLGTILTLGLGAMCFMPFTFLMYPLMFLAIVWMEQSMNGIMIDNLHVIEAVKQGWSLIRNNLLSVALVAVVIYFGVGMISSVLMMPFMFGFFMMPMGFVGHEINWIILLIGLLSLMIFVPLFALYTGWVTAFSKSAWILTYLHLKPASPMTQSALQPATA
jgi:hypothetical protein